MLLLRCPARPTQQGSQSHLTPATSPLAIETATGIAITIGTIGAINARRVATDTRTVAGTITGGMTAIPIKAGTMKALADCRRRRHHLDRRLDRRPADLVDPVPAGIIRS